jgi:cyclophilin family peptidyl-prolyl cis-trans isomerase/HEAT repeat protein
MRHTVVVVTCSAAVLFALAAAGAAASQTGGSRPAVTRAAIIEAEDARAATADQLQVLTVAAASGPVPLQVLAVRALGRLERPELTATIVPLLDHSQPSVRAEAANALAQSAGNAEAAQRTAREALMRRLVGERDAEVRGAIAESLARLPIDSPATATDTEKALFDVASRTEVTRHLDKSSAGPRIIGLTLTPTKEVAVPAPALIGALRGFEAFARGRARAGQSLMPETVDLLKAIVLAGPRSLPRVRALALLCLLPANAVDRTLAATALDDPDVQVRRLAVSSSQADLMTLLRAMKNPAWPVRYEALLRYGRRFQAAEGCEPIVGAIGARADHLSLLAIDLLAGPCRAGDHAVETLLDLAAGIGGGDWHRPAHALVAVAKAAPERARPMLARFLSATDWQSRMYAARAAGQLGDAKALRQLAGDANDNVREAAVAQLSIVEGHGADAVYVEALGAADFQLVMAAAKALTGSPGRVAAVPALFAALSRLTALDSDCSRDPRLAVLERLQELGSPNDAGQLRPYLSDVDPRVAATASRVLTAWTGSAVAATPRPRPASAFSMTDADFDRLAHSVVRVTMSGGKQFEVRLLMDLAPASSARFAALVSRGYYNGLTFHRVIPNFLVQGGSPGANEFSGASRYMRDEAGRTSQTRGTLGASTRGRDTGDAQFYINLVDTPRLDHEYSIFGEVTSGMDVVDTILEGDVMQRVELVAARAKK